VLPIAILTPHAPNNHFLPLFYSYLRLSLSEDGMTRTDCQDSFFSVGCGSREQTAQRTNTETSIII